MVNEMTSDAHTLRYLDAGHVNHPFGTLAGLMLCSDTDEKLGTISGVLVEPASRCVRHFVVERRVALMTRHYLLAADTPTVLEADVRKLRVLAGSSALERFDARQVEHFSEEDAITAMFARPAA